MSWNFTVTHIQLVPTTTPKRKTMSELPPFLGSVLPPYLTLSVRVRVRGVSGRCLLFSPSASTAPL